MEDVSVLRMEDVSVLRMEDVSVLRMEDVSVLRVQCCSCGKWYSESEVGVSLAGFIPFMANYNYMCKMCGTESIAKKAASFLQIAITVLANLMQQNSGKQFFHVEEEIEPFIEREWDKICTNRTKSQLWRANLQSKLADEKRLFRQDSSNPLKFSLLDPDLSTVGPKRYESKPLQMKPGKKRHSEGGGSFGLKRRVDVDPDFMIGGPAAKKLKIVEEVTTSKLHGYPLEHPFNKDCYRYVWAEPDPHHPDRDIASDELAGRPIPSEMYRAVVEPRVMLSLNDRAHQLKVSDDRMTVTGDKGYCMIRATHGVHVGTWYFEVHIDSMSAEDNSAMRIGWSQSIAGNLQAPCGYDKLSYSWRSCKGSVFHQSRGKHFSDGGYKEGDTIGFLIHLPKKSFVSTLSTTNHKNQPLIKFKNFLYFEEKETVEDAEKMLNTLKGSKIMLYRNGVCEGTAFSDINVGTYYPTLSIYKAASATVNFGPTFKHPLRNLKCKPMSAAANVVAVEKLMADMLYHVQSRVTTDSKSSDTVPPFQ